MTSRQLQLYITTQSPCGYFSNRVSRNLVPDPKLTLNTAIYNQLIEYGFRRSGAHCYRPHCHSGKQGCQACIACRLAVNDFSSSRSQRRCLKSNLDLTLSISTAGFSDETFELYRRYLNHRHIDGSMTNPDESDFRQFLYCDWSETQFLEFRQDDKLLAVAVTDIVSNGVSAVYSFFDPQACRRSLGTFCILQQIAYAKTLGLDYVYLGYWIKNHPKMHYKNNFKPLQFYLDEQWQTQGSEIVSSSYSLPRP